MSVTQTGPSLTMNPQLEGVGLRPEDVLHGDLECLAVLPVRREDAEA